MVGESRGNGPFQRRHTSPRRAAFLSSPMPRYARALAAFALLALGCAVPALAHDSWFEPLPSPAAGEVRLAAGTGNRFPVMESSIGEARLPAAACRHGPAPEQPLRVLRETPQAQWLQGSPTTAASREAGHGSIVCWAQLPTYEITLRGAVVKTYHDEVRAPAALRATWAAQEQRGLPWRERYTKYLRIELIDPRLGNQAAPPPQPTGLAMEIVPERASLAAGEELRFVVLRDGQALPGFELELVSASANVGFWLKTDAAGRAEVRVPLPGRWLLRGTDIRADVQRPEQWDSRFVTLAFEATAK
jgi:hypothetical protein